MMTPELKTACEVVFQEHKASGDAIRWNKDAFQGRISFGLSALAKETLMQKRIIYVADPSKKVMTLLNPDVMTAANFEEAEELVQQKPLAPVISIHHLAYKINGARDGDQPARDLFNDDAVVTDMKWYRKSAFWYFIWPLCAMIAGALIAWFLGWLYTQFFL